MKDKLTKCFSWMHKHATVIIFAAFCIQSYIANQNYKRLDRYANMLVGCSVLIDSQSARIEQLESNK